MIQFNTQVLNNTLIYYASVDGKVTFYTLDAVNGRKLADAVGELQRLGAATRARALKTEAP